MMGRLKMLREDYRTNEDKHKHPCSKGAQRHKGTVLGAGLAEGAEERAVGTLDSVGFDIVDDGGAREHGLKASPTNTRNPS